MRIYFLCILTVFLLLAAFQRVVQTKSLAKHRKFVKRELNSGNREIEQRADLTTRNITRRRFQRQPDHYCGPRLRVKVAMVCRIGYFAPESERVRSVTSQRSTREIVVRIPRDISRECCKNECPDSLILKYCKPRSTVYTTTTTSTSTTTEHPPTENPQTVPTVTESNSVGLENQMNLESLSVSSARNLITVITDPPDYNVFAVNQQTNDVLNY